jgi:hypothetical protein
MRPSELLAIGNGVHCPLSAEQAIQANPNMEGSMLDTKSINPDDGTHLPPYSGMDNRAPVVGRSSDSLRSGAGLEQLDPLRGIGL